MGRNWPALSNLMSDGISAQLASLENSMNLVTRVWMCSDRSTEGLGLYGFLVSALLGQYARSAYRWVSDLRFTAEELNPLLKFSDRGTPTRINLLGDRIPSPDY